MAAFKYVYVVMEEELEGIEVFKHIVAAFTKESDAHKYASVHDDFSVETVLLDTKPENWGRKIVVEDSDYPNGFRLRYFVGEEYNGTEE